jgi:2-oxoglutarate dehydrogenase E2 component (dihydrolipoamide succinyltransferase)
MKSQKTLEMKVPSVGESITEVTISAWTKKDGDFVKLDEVIAEIESDKATFELTAIASGTLKIVVKEGTTIPVGELICTITESEVTESPGKQPAQEVKSPSKDRESYAKGHPSPAAAVILEEKDIPASQVDGTGPGGRITTEDALKAGPSITSKTPTPVKNEPVLTTPAIDVRGARTERREKLSTLRKSLARRLVSAKNETAMLTTFNEVNMQPVMELRKKYKDVFKEKYEVNLGFMSFFTKACCIALREWPSVNAMIDGEEIIFHDYCDISIAVSAPKGLVVPVIRNAGGLSFAEIEREVARLAGKARDNKLTIEEMSGGTFTITNGGVFGSMLSTPIINVPQSAILGMHNITERPIAENGQVVIRPVMYLALSYDHRIIDGRESVSFLVRVKQLLEDPARLLLEI